MKKNTVELEQLKKGVDYTISEIIDQFIQEDNAKPWIIGFSGGKDSTILLQLVWYAMKKLPHEIRNMRHIYVICNNTQVENPHVLEFVHRTLTRVKKAAVEQGLPITVHETTPELEDSFWVNLLGKGYPSPNSTFRWCTERLKIKPTTKFILDKIDKHGEVIILLGTRSAESSTRARSIKKYKIGNQRLRNHQLNNAKVYAPISDFTTEEVWQYLSSVPAPWGGNHHELITLYMNGSGGDCPLILDINTPSCGNSRFGCWVCTVVTHDKSMSALVDNGQEWMEPLMEFRNLLQEKRNDETWRSKVRRNGQQGTGPFLLEKRYELLTILLKAQVEIQKDNPSLELISQQELVAIQIIWYRDGGFMYKISDIYNQVYGKNLKFNMTTESEKEEKELLKSVCAGKDQYFKLINDLLEIELKEMYMNRRSEIYKNLEQAVSEFAKTQK